ncbi:MAG TPA: hypothetical protein VGI85_14405 [Chthoniobacterales bacterium]
MNNPAASPDFRGAHAPSRARFGALAEMTIGPGAMARETIGEAPIAAREARALPGNPTATFSADSLPNEPMKL